MLCGRDQPALDSDQALDLLQRSLPARLNRRQWFRGQPAAERSAGKVHAACLAPGPSTRLTPTETGAAASRNPRLAADQRLGEGQGAKPASSHRPRPATDARQAMARPSRVPPGRITVVHAKHLRQARSSARPRNLAEACPQHASCPCPRAGAQDLYALVGQTMSGTTALIDSRKLPCQGSPSALPSASTGTMATLRVSESTIASPVITSSCHRTCHGVSCRQWPSTAVRRRRIAHGAATSSSV